MSTTIVSAATFDTQPGAGDKSFLDTPYRQANPVKSGRFGEIETDK